MEENKQTALQAEEIVKKADASVKSMDDFTSPEVLYKG